VNPPAHDVEYVDLAAQRTSGGPSRSGERCWKLLEAIEDLDICARALRGKAVRAPEAGEPADAGRQRLWAMRVTGPGVNDTGPEEGVGRLAHARLDALHLAAREIHDVDLVERIARIAFALEHHAPAIRGPAAFPRGRTVAPADRHP